MNISYIMNNFSWFISSKFTNHKYYIEAEHTLYTPANI